MLCNAQIKSIRDAVKAHTEFKTVLWGVSLPRSVAAVQWAADTLPACFFWGGQSVIDPQYTEGQECAEDQVMTCYVFYYHQKASDAYNDDDQSDGIEALNDLELIVVKEILDHYTNLGWTGQIKIDRDLTFDKMGAIFNFMPPFYGSRIDFGLSVKAVDVETVTI